MCIYQIYYIYNNAEFGQKFIHAICLMLMTLGISLCVCLYSLKRLCVYWYLSIRAHLHPHHRRRPLLVHIIESDFVQADAAELVYRTQT